MKKTFLLSVILLLCVFLANAQSTPWISNGYGIYYNKGHVSVNTPTPDTPMEFSVKGQQIIYGQSSSLIFGGINNTNEGWGEYGIEYNGAAGGLNFWKPYGNSYNAAVKNWILFLKDDGRVGIGTKDLTDGYKLTVKGGINAQEVLVTVTAGGADFVFDKGFKLQSLPELENYVTANKHLPDIPSAKEMEKTGLKMGEFQIKLLQKVEELTLYVIKQQKEIEELKTKINNNK